MPYKLAGGDAGAGIAAPALSARASSLLFSPAFFTTALARGLVGRVQRREATRR